MHGKCLTELFVGLVIAQFQYALPAFASVSDINSIHAIFAKVFKWRLKTKLFN